MVNEQLEETRQIPVQKGPQPDSPEESSGKRRRFPWWAWVLAGVAVLLALAAMGAFAGYRTGIQDRLLFERSQQDQSCKQQFDLGVDDLAAKNYTVARQRFEYVIGICPAYPNVTEMLAETLLALNTTATATPVPTPTLTPTPDLRGAEELFDQAQGLLSVNDWNAALATLDTLRKKQPDYRPIEVDGMYYVALRNRGIEKIQQGNLEGGTYDLARAERFGPLDTEAEAWRTWANLYTTGASFWEINWPQAIFYFGQLAQVAPNLRDLSNFTATERLRTALISYGDQLASAGDYCSAQAQYDQALAFGDNPQLQPTATNAAEQCWTPTPDLPTPPAETIPAPTAEATRPEPPPATTQPPAPEPTPVPSETPTPGP